MATSISAPLERLRGAIDLHVHVPPDMIPRAQDVPTLLHQAREAGMAGLVLKDHTACTAGLAYTLNSLHPQGPRCYGALALNPTVGGLNPYAVEAALRQGAAIIYMPTYGASAGLPHQPGGFAPTFPRPSGPGITLWGQDGQVLPVVHQIIAVMADLGNQTGGVLATGHLSPKESLTLLRLARQAGVKKLLVTHGATVAMPMALQREAVALGAMVEQTLQCTAPLGAGTSAVTMPELAAQIRALGPEHVIVSSDFGQVPNGPVVAGYARYLQALAGEGISEAEIRQMIVVNPARLLA